MVMMNNNHLILSQGGASCLLVTHDRGLVVV